MRPLEMLLMILIPFGILSAVSHLIPDLYMTPKARGRAGVTLLFLLNGVAHFTNTAAIAAMIPSFVPSRLGLTQLTGILEILAAIGLWAPRIRHLVGDLLVLYTIAVIPTDIYAAMNHVAIDAHLSPAAYLLIRIPFQFLLTGWIYWSAIHDEEWVRRRRGARGSSPRRGSRAGGAPRYARAR